MELTTDDVRAVAGRRYWKGLKRRLIAAAIVCALGVVLIFSSAFVGDWGTNSIYAIKSGESVPVLTESGDYTYEVKRHSGVVYLNGVVMERTGGSERTGGGIAMLVIGLVTAFSGLGILVYAGWREGKYKNDFVDEWIKSQKS